MTTLIFAQVASNNAAALFVNGVLHLTLGDAGSLEYLELKATKLADALQVSLLRSTIPDPAQSNWAWQDMYSQVQNRATATTSVKVKHWNAYDCELPTDNTHQFDIDDLRRSSGQVRVVLAPLEGATHDVLDVLVEVELSPLDGLTPVQCAHVHLDPDDALFSIFKVGDKLLLRPETKVTVEPEVMMFNGAPEQMFWIG